MEGPDGAFYGTTTQGGPYDPALGSRGTIYKITSTSMYTRLHSFADVTGGYYPEGFFPVAGLVELAGNFYGTTGGGGLDRYGTIFRWTPGTPGVLTVLHHFSRYDRQRPAGGVERLAPMATSMGRRLPQGHPTSTACSTK